MKPRLLIAGIGNVFLGDDAFGVHVVQRLAECALPETVCVRDYGIRGVDLTVALTEGYSGAILIDALVRGHAPGTLCVIEPRLEDAADEPALMQMHVLDPVNVLRLAATLASLPPWLRLVGCEPETVDERMTLSDVVAAAIDGAMHLVQGLAAEFFSAAETIGLTSASTSRRPPPPAR